MKQELFATQPSNSHQSLIVSDTESWDRLSPRLNRSRLTGDWKKMDFSFQQLDKRAKLLPDICTVYFSGVLAFRRALLSDIFPAPCSSIEFLPIRASNEDWLLLNCLKTTSLYDRETIECIRGAAGEIALVQRVDVQDSSVYDCELFTLEDSNRAQLFAVTPFVDRIKNLRLRGIDFRELGSVIR